MSDALGGALSGVGAEVRRIGAFLRRDWLVLLSYRAAFVTDGLSLLAQVVLFSFLSQMIAPDAVPSYGSRQPSYLEFVSIGLLINAFLGVGLTGLVSVVRAEQTIGTLEQLLGTPMRLVTFKLGSGLFGFLYVPVRMLVLFALLIGFLGTSFDVSGLGPALVVLAAFVPAVWGIGLAAAGLVLVVRRGDGAAGFANLVLAAASGAYFPVALLPAWLEPLMAFNPVTIALEASRAALLGGAGWGAVPGPLWRLVLTGVVTVALGSWVFRRCLRRELRAGTLHLY